MGSPLRRLPVESQEPSHPRLSKTRQKSPEPSGCPPPLTTRRERCSWTVRDSRHLVDRRVAPRLLGKAHHDPSPSRGRGDRCDPGRRCANGYRTSTRPRTCRTRRTRCTRRTRSHRHLRRLARVSTRGTARCRTRVGLSQGDEGVRAGHRREAVGGRAVRRRRQHRLLPRRSRRDAHFLGGDEPHALDQGPDRVDRSHHDVHQSRSLEARSRPSLSMDLARGAAAWHQRRHRRQRAHRLRFLPAASHRVLPAASGPVCRRRHLLRQPHQHRAARGR